MGEKLIIGRKELISIVDLELFDLDAKVDTGADSSALHCDDIFIDDAKMVHFTLLDEIHEAYNGRKIVMPLYRVKKVKSSNGVVQHRPSIRVNVDFFGKRHKAIISLTDRSDMQFPMLIGRKFLSGKFLVDVSKEYLCKEISSKENR